MAAYLLDTCTALWFFEGSERIPGDVRRILVDPANTIYFSDVSLMEIVIKHRLGKLPLPRSPSRIILPLARKHGMEGLPLVSAAILRLESLPALHGDPFDRLLICQAMEHELVLATPDERIRQYDVPCRWGG